MAEITNDNDLLYKRISDSEFEFIFNNLSEEIKFDEKYKSSSKEELNISEQPDNALIQNKNNSIFSKIKKLFINIKNRITGVKYLGNNELNDNSNNYNSSENIYKTDDSFKSYVEIRGENLKKFNLDVQNVVKNNKSANSKSKTEENEIDKE